MFTKIVYNLNQKRKFIKTFIEKIGKFISENNIANLKQLTELTGISYTTLRDFYDTDKSRENNNLKIKKDMFNKTKGKQT